MKHILMGSFIIDTEDLELCKKHRWWFSKHKNYSKVMTSINDKQILLARYLLNYNGNLQIDHINRNPLDNRRKNLRIASPVENNANKDGKNTQLYPNGKYKCYFIRYGQYFYLGYFNSKEEAMEAKRKKLTEIEANKDYYLSEYKKMTGDKIKGVTITPSGKWRADIIHNGKHTRIGTYNTKEEAAIAREEYLRKICG